MFSGGQVHAEAEATSLRLDRQHTFPGSWSQCHRRIGDTGRLLSRTGGYKLVLNSMHLGPYITYRSSTGRSEVLLNDQTSNV